MFLLCVFAAAQTNHTLRQGINAKPEGERPTNTSAKAPLHWFTFKRTPSARAPSHCWLCASTHGPCTSGISRDYACPHNVIAKWRVVRTTSPSHLACVHRSLHTGMPHKALLATCAAHARWLRVPFAFMRLERGLKSSLALRQRRNGKMACHCLANVCKRGAHA